MDVVRLEANAIVADFEFHNPIAPLQLDGDMACLGVAADVGQRLLPHA